MVKLTVCCAIHKKPVTFYVREREVWLGYICADCGAHVKLEVQPNVPDPAAPEPEKGISA
jgi:hypothetical protein